MKTKKTFELYIKENTNKPLEISTKNFNVVIQNNFLNQNIDLKKCLNILEQQLPSIILKNIDIIYLGSFEPLKQKQVQSLYFNGAIFLSNEIENEEDLILSLIHECAHALEENDREYVYDDGEIEKEFLMKRIQAYNVLKTQGYDNLNKNDFYNLSYDINLDNIFKNIIGYSTLAGFTSNIFLSPYAITSYREYFANGFEKYFSGKAELVKKISPAIFEKLSNIEF